MVVGGGGNEGRPGLGAVKKTKSETEWVRNRERASVMGSGGVALAGLKLFSPVATDPPYFGEWGGGEREKGASQAFPPSEARAQKKKEPPSPKPPACKPPPLLPFPFPPPPFLSFFLSFLPGHGCG